MERGSEDKGSKKKKISRHIMKEKQGRSKRGIERKIN